MRKTAHEAPQTILAGTRAFAAPMIENLIG
jgi:hypothetical protein